MKMQRFAGLLLALALLLPGAVQASPWKAPEAPAATVDSASRSGVPALTYRAVQAAVRAVDLRTSLRGLAAPVTAVALQQNADGSWSEASGLSAGDGERLGLGVWLMPMYQADSVWGMDAGNGQDTGYVSGLGGGSVGLDYMFEKFMLGVAFNGGTGYSVSRGDGPTAHSNFSVWGVNLYSALYLGDFSLSGDVGYSAQYARSRSGDVLNSESDTRSSSWTVGLRGEYLYRAGFMDVIPHAGVRYTGSNAYKYSEYQNGQAVFDIKPSFQSTWAFPVGVAFSKGIESGGGWMFTPSLDLYVTPVAGDLYSRSDSRLLGAAAVTETRTQMLDRVTYSAAAGLGIGKDDLALGLNYTLDVSPHRTGHGANLSLRYSF